MACPRASGFISPGMIPLAGGPFVSLVVFGEPFE